MTTTIKYVTHAVAWKTSKDNAETMLLFIGDDDLPMFFVDAAGKRYNVDEIWNHREQDRKGVMHMHKGS